MTEDDMEWLSPLYDTFWKVTQYFDVKSVMAFHDYDTDNMGKYFGMGSDGVFFGGDKALGLSAHSLAELVDEFGVCAGIGFPLPDNNELAGRLEELLEFVGDIGQGLFLSTPWEIDPDLPVELIHKAMDIIRA